MFILVQDVIITLSNNPKYFDNFIDFAPRIWYTSSVLSTQPLRERDIYMTNDEILLALSNMLDSIEDYEMIKQDMLLLKKVVDEYIESTQKDL